MLFAERREGMAGVWGVRGEKRSPEEREVPETMGGSEESWREDELLAERWFMMDWDMESLKTVFDSRRRWNFDSAAFVRREAASATAGSVGTAKDLRSFFWSSIFKKSEMLSSSVLMEPEDAGSASIPEPGWAIEEDAEALPLELLSSSSLLPPAERRFRRWPKLLL